MREREKNIPKLTKLLRVVTKNEVHVNYFPEVESEISSRRVFLLPGHFRAFPLLLPFRLFFFF